MRTEDSDFLIHNQQTSTFFKMTKGKTAMLLVMIICSCGLIFAITDAYPTPDPEPMDENKLTNTSRLVITHVVKTIEFEVGIVDDDGVVDENTTDSDAPEFYETDIELLNLDLLKEVVNQATGEEDAKNVEQSTTMEVPQSEDISIPVNQTSS